MAKYGTDGLNNFRRSKGTKGARGAVLKTFEWFGGDIELRARRANARALIAIGENVVVAGKRHAHVISGTLRRSVHSAPVEYDASGDEAMASPVRKGGEAKHIPNATDPEKDVSWHGWANSVAAIQAGSWAKYACVEESGRGHMFMTPAVEEVRGARSVAIMRQAYREEGLL